MLSNQILPSSNKSNMQSCGNIIHDFMYCYKKQQTSTKKFIVS